MNEFFCIFLLHAYIQGYIASLNVEEIELVTYDISLSKHKSTSDEANDHNHVLISSKYGEKFYCIIPDIKISKPIIVKNVNEFQKNISASLKPLLKAPCLLFNKGWWTYEFCYKRYIHQYHLQDGKVRGMQTYLGTYSHEYNWTSELIDSKKYFDENYHIQYYNNGTYCDASKMPREATIKFYCTTKSDYISDVEEYQPCSYMVHIHTKHLCKNPFFNKKETQEIHKINCLSKSTKTTIDVHKHDNLDTLQEKDNFEIEDNNFQGIDIGIDNNDNKPIEKGVEDLVGVNLDDSNFEESHLEDVQTAKSRKSSIKIVLNKEAFEDKVDHQSLVKLLINNLLRNDKTKERKRFTKLYEAYYNQQSENKKSKEGKNKKDLIIF